MEQTIQYVSEQANRVLIVSNPSAGARADRTAIEQLQQELQADGLTVERISDLDSISPMVGDPNQARVRAVVAVGGDGTISAVVNRTPPDTPLAVLPSGTENLLAKYLHATTTPRELCHTITHGATVALDAGTANGRVFLLMVGCGFDAEVVRRLDAIRSGHIRHLSYAKPILDSVRSYEYPALRVTFEPISELPRGASNPIEKVRGPGLEATAAASFVARWLFVVNLPRYAGGLRFAPDATGSDGLLDVCAFDRGSLFDGLRYLAGVALGKHLAWRDCRIFRSRKIQIDSDQEVPYQLDGDPGGVLPVEIGVLPARVRLIVTESWALRRGFRHVARS